MTPTKARRIDVRITNAMAKRLDALARRLASTRSEAARLMIEKGLESKAQVRAKQKESE